MPRLPLPLFSNFPSNSPPESKLLQSIGTCPLTLGELKDNTGLDYNTLRQRIRELMLNQQVETGMVDGVLKVWRK
jgi:predicted transcriptional regulator